MPAAASVWLCQSGTHTRCCAVARKKGSTDAIIAACDEVSATSQSAEPVEARLGEQVAKVLSDFCATIRKEAVSGHIAVLDACDYVRDDALTEIGVRLEDATREGESSTWKLDDPETLKKEVAAKRAEAAERAKQAAQKNVAKKQKELAKLEAAALPVMEALAALDQVAYVRFASVYRNFREAKDFEEFITDELAEEAD